MIEEAEVIKRGRGRPRKNLEEVHNNARIMHLMPQVYTNLAVSNEDLDNQWTTVSGFEPVNPEESMTPNETLNDVSVTIAAPVEPEKPAEPEKPKLYTFKVLRHTNFALPDFEVIDVDEEGNWLPPRAPNPLEYGAHTKVWAGTIVNVNAARAKTFDRHGIGKRIENYE